MNVNSPGGGSTSGTTSYNPSQQSKSSLSTPDLHLKTCFVLNDERRILSTREPSATRGPLFTIVTGQTNCAWAVHADVSPALASELDRLARDEPPGLDFRAAPAHADRYISLLREQISELPDTKASQSDGPAFEFPDSIAEPADVVFIEDEEIINHHFLGWIPGEIAAVRAPVTAILENAYPVSVCFCARRSDIAAEAGVETSEAYRGRGFGPRVTTAWALAVRASGKYRSTARRGQTTPRSRYLRNCIS